MDDSRLACENCGKFAMMAKLWRDMMLCLACYDDLTRDKGPDMEDLLAEVEDREDR